MNNHEHAKIISDMVLKYIKDNGLEADIQCKLNEKTCKATAVNGFLNLEIVPATQSAVVVVIGNEDNAKKQIAENDAYADEYNANLIAGGK